jgi:hypothetical protein
MCGGCQHQDSARGWPAARCSCSAGRLPWVGRFSDLSVSSSNGMAAQWGTIRLASNEAPPPVDSMAASLPARHRHFPHWPPVPHPGWTVWGDGTTKRANGITLAGQNVRDSSTSVPRLPWPQSLASRSGPPTDLRTSYTLVTTLRLCHAIQHAFR